MKKVLLNDLCPEMDIEMNGEFYEMETIETGVIYRIENVLTGKSYIGRTKSYYPGKRNGAICRFHVHWNRAHSDGPRRNDCPIFFEVLRASQMSDWFVFTMDVLPLLEMKDAEAEYIQEYKTYDADYGYNYFVGNNKPLDVKYSKQYCKLKAESNTNRAKNSAMKRTETNKKLPTYINYYCNYDDGKLVNEGYLVRIKLGEVVYQKRFLSMNESMSEKLERAEKYLKELQDMPMEAHVPVEKKPEKTLPKNISYTKYKNGSGKMNEGYMVRIKINGKLHTKKFMNPIHTLNQKLEMAIDHLEKLNKSATKTVNKQEIVEI